MPSPDNAGSPLSEALQRRGVGQSRLHLIVRDDWPRARPRWVLWLWITYALGIGFGAAVLAWSLLASFP